MIRSRRFELPLIPRPKEVEPIASSRRDVLQDLHDFLTAVVEARKAASD